MSITVPEELKQVYLLLLKAGPITIGELTLLLKKEANLKEKVNSLVKANLVKEIESYGEIPLFMALPPFTTINSQLNSMIKTSKRKQANLIAGHQSIEKKLKSSLGQLQDATDFNDSLKEIELKNNH